VDLQFYAKGTALCHDGFWYDVRSEIAVVESAPEADRRTDACFGVLQPHALLQGISQLTLGSKAKLSCTPDYGYGAEGAPPKIPPNSDLVFEVELLQIGEEKASSGCALQ
jgi:hypothetical protein